MKSTCRVGSKSHLQQSQAISILAPNFTYEGFDFKQLERCGDVALFSKVKPKQTATFEVIVVQRHPARNIFGRNYPEREAMPPSESWGTFGWSMTSIERARAKFDELVSRQERGVSPSDHRMEAAA